MVDDWGYTVWSNADTRRFMLFVRYWPGAEDSVREWGCSRAWTVRRARMWADEWGQGLGRDWSGVLWEDVAAAFREMCDGRRKRAGA